MTIGRVGKDGAVIIPAELRRRFGLVEGASIVAKVHPDRVLVRVATADTSRPADHDLLLEETNRADAVLRADSQAWEDELAARRLWETTLADGLEDEPRSDDGGNGAETGEPDRRAAGSSGWLSSTRPGVGSKRVGARSSSPRQTPTTPTRPDLTWDSPSPQGCVTSPFTSRFIPL